MSRWGSKSVTFDDFALLSTKGIREEIEAFLCTGTANIVAEDIRKPQKRF